MSRIEQVGYLDASPSGLLLYESADALKSQELDKCYDLEVDLETYRNMRTIAQGTKIAISGLVGEPTPIFPDGSSVHILKQSGRMSSLICGRRQIVRVKNFHIVPE
jgi:hypothetical protein